MFLLVIFWFVGLLDFVESSRVDDFRHRAYLSRDGNRAGRLVNLTYLNLSSNQIVDVSPLATLVNLKRLRLEYNHIVDVAPLAGLRNLKELRLDVNQIVDVSPLAGLVNLERLWLNNNQIVDTSPLRSLKNTTIHGGNWVCQCCTIV